MDSTEPTKQRKPRKPRLTNATKPEEVAVVNPIEASIKQARKAYGSTTGETDLVPSNAISEPTKGKADSEGNESKGMGEGKAGQGKGTPTVSPLPSPRAHGQLATPSQYVKSLAPELVELWAASVIATGKRQQWLITAQPQIGRENNRYRSDLVRELESHPVAIETLSRLKAEEVMSDLDRRRLLKAIAHAPEHGLRGFADNLKAIELDSRHDADSVENKRKAESASGSLTIGTLQAFFLPSTLARSLTAQPVQVVELEASAIAPPLDPPPGGG